MPFILQRGSPGSFTWCQSHVPKSCTAGHVPVPDVQRASGLFCVTSATVPLTKAGQKAKTTCKGRKSRLRLSRGGAARSQRKGARCRAGAGRVQGGGGCSEAVFRDPHNTEGSHQPRPEDSGQASQTWGHRSWAASRRSSRGTPRHSGAGREPGQSLVSSPCRINSRGTGLLSALGL